MNFLPFALPETGEEEIAEVADTIRSGWMTTGPKVARFEAEFAEYVGVRYALAVNSATAGLPSCPGSGGHRSRGSGVDNTLYFYSQCRGHPVPWR